MSSNISVDIGSSYDSLIESITSVSSSLSSGGIIELSSDSSPLSASSRVSDNKFPASNCANVIKSPVCYFEDTAQGMHDTAGSIFIASA